MAPIGPAPTRRARSGGAEGGGVALELEFHLLGADRAADVDCQHEFQIHRLKVVAGRPGSVRWARRAGGGRNRRRAQRQSPHEVPSSHQVIRCSGYPCASIFPFSTVARAYCATQYERAGASRSAAATSPPPARRDTGRARRRSHEREARRTIPRRGPGNAVPPGSGCAKARNRKPSGAATRSRRRRSARRRTAGTARAERGGSARAGEASRPAGSQVMPRGRDASGALTEPRACGRPCIRGC